MLMRPCSSRYATSGALLKQEHPQRPDVHDGVQSQSSPHLVVQTQYCCLSSESEQLDVVRVLFLSLVALDRCLVDLVWVICLSLVALDRCLFDVLVACASTLTHCCTLVEGRSLPNVQVGIGVVKFEVSPPPPPPISFPC
jgi:hypothetical protein